MTNTSKTGSDTALCLASIASEVSGGVKGYVQSAKGGLQPPLISWEKTNIWEQLICWALSILITDYWVLGCVFCHHATRHWQWWWHTLMRQAQKCNVHDIRESFYESFQNFHKWYKKKLYTQFGWEIILKCIYIYCMMWWCVCYTRGLLSMNCAACIKTGIMIAQCVHSVGGSAV